MTEEEFILDAVDDIEGRATTPKVFITFKSFSHRQSSIYCLRRGSIALPATCRSVIDKLYRSDDVYDTADPRTSITSALPGAMRSWHQNDSLFLPTLTFDEDKLDGKAKAYHDYIIENKRLQNKQAKKDVKGGYTGYIEFTPCTTVENQWARIVYNYVEDFVYFSPSHYTPFTVDTNPQTKVRTVTVQSSYRNNLPDGWHNPFFFVR